MDASRIDILEIYRRYSAIKSGRGYVVGDEGCRLNSDSQKAKLSREALTQLLKLVESRASTGLSVFDELSMLKSRLNLMEDFSEFSRFYEFVFFMCREDGQKNITVSMAVTAWKFVLAGRFPLLHQWCDFVEKNQRYNISEDTWQQVLAFSWCTRDNLQGYDREGAWPVLIDDFVEHMYSISGCKCGDPEPLSCVLEDKVPELRSSSGLKRKFAEDTGKHDMDCIDVSDNLIVSDFKRIRAHGAVDLEDNPSGYTTDEDIMETSRQNSPLCSSSKSPCAVEGCLSKGFAGLLSTSSYVHFGRERRDFF